MGRIATTTDSAHAVLGWMLSEKFRENNESYDPTENTNLNGAGVRGYIPTQTDTLYRERKFSYTYAYCRVRA